MSKEKIKNELSIELSSLIYDGEHGGTITLDKVLLLSQKVAREFYDGHFTLFGFTTNFKFAFGTPLTFWPNDDEDSIGNDKYKPHDNIMAAVLSALIDELLVG